ncbi:MAG TPA: STY4528 family pathogenicity island replication protein [Burkholderiaceae bacterium]
MKRRSSGRDGRVAPSAPPGSTPTRSGPAGPAGDGRTSAGDRVLFSGNRHESVPRALFLDRRLTPLERNAWQVFRLGVRDDAATAFPTYEELRPYLASMPCAGPASHETVARALKVLRLTRWLSLVRRRRDPKTGCIQGNVYVLHDEPLTPFEAMQLDPEYLTLVGQALTHAARSVRAVAVNTLREIAEDPLLAGRLLPTRLQVLTQRLAAAGWTQAGCPQDDAVHDSEEGPADLLRNRGNPSSDSEAGRDTAPIHSLRIPKAASTVRIEEPLPEIRTTEPRARSAHGLRLPDRFLALKDEQQAGALVALQQVDPATRQAVLDEWAARCRGGVVRSPAGYLFGIIQKALRGEFKPCAGAAGSPSELAGPRPPPPFPPAAPSPVAGREVVQACLARLRSTLGGH